MICPEDESLEGSLDGGGMTITCPYEESPEEVLLEVGLDEASLEVGLEDSSLEVGLEDSSLEVCELSSELVTEESSEEVSEPVCEDASLEVSVETSELVSDEVSELSSDDVSALGVSPIGPSAGGLFSINEESEPPWSSITVITSFALSIFSVAGFSPP